MQPQKLTRGLGSNYQLRDCTVYVADQAAPVLLRVTIDVMPHCDSIIDALQHVLLNWREM